MSLWRNLRRKLPLVSKIYALRADVARLREEVQTLQLSLYAVEGLRDSIRRLETEVESLKARQGS